MEGSNSSENEASKFWLEEYKVLAADIQNRVTLQHWLLNFHIFVIVALLGFVASLVKESGSVPVNYQKFLSVEFSLCFEIIPFISIFFLWRHLNHDVNIIDKARYINSVLRSNIVRISGIDSVLDFERFLESCRRERVAKFSALIYLGSEHFFHSFLAIISLAVAWIIFIYNIANLSVSGRSFSLIIDLILLTASTLITLLTIRVRQRVHVAYNSIVSDPEAASSSQGE